VIHTGDFKIDAQPFYGQMMDLDAFSKAGDEGVLLLMSDSTNVERHEHSLSESIIYQKFEQLFAAAEGLTIVSMFASNLGRMGQVFELAKKLDKKIVLSGRSMEQNVRLGGAAGYLIEAANRMIRFEDIEKYREIRL
jgi:ribonuclease J